jgi:ABC-2 type transport system permease protein
MIGSELSPPPVAGRRLLGDALLIAGRTGRHWRAQPGATAVTLLFPVLVMLMMGGLFGGAISGSATDYIPYVVPGVLALTMLFGIETTMVAITTDAGRGVTDRFRSLPMSSGAVVLGRCLADMAASVVALVVMTAAGFALGWRWERGLVLALAAYGLLLLLRFGLLWLGLYVGLIAGSPEAVAAVQILVWPIGFLSTVFVDPATMPDWLGWLAHWNPLSATASAIRDLFGNPQGIASTWPAEHALGLALLWPILLTVVFAPLATAAYRGLRR